jgi:hypothetical protein
MSYMSTGYYWLFPQPAPTIPQRTLPGPETPYDADAIRASVVSPAPAPATTAPVTTAAQSIVGGGNTKIGLAVALPLVAITGVLLLSRRGAKPARRSRRR